MNTTYETVKQKADKFIKHYRNDLLKIDKEYIENRPGIKFIHITRESGTALIQFMPVESYPKNGEKAKYLFGTATNREILKGERQTVEHYIKQEPLLFLYYNGEEVKKITSIQAMYIFSQYEQGLIKAFETHN